MRCPVCGCTLISIHALLAESDFYRNPVYHNHRKFLSTLSLRRATLPSRTALEALLFLSTLSLRRATQAVYRVVHGTIYFYPRSPCGERPIQYAYQGFAKQFLSTLSLRRATTGTTSAGKQQSISIHALLAESDRSRPRLLSGCRAFLSTLSLRRATVIGSILGTVATFLSTLSLRRATADALVIRRLPVISIHALLAESDPWFC